MDKLCIECGVNQAGMWGMCLPCRSDPLTPEQATLKSLDYDHRRIVAGIKQAQAEVDRLTALELEISNKIHALEATL